MQFCAASAVSDLFNKGAKELGSLSLLSSKDQGMVKPVFSSEVGGNRVFENVTKILSTKLC